MPSRSTMLHGSLVLAMVLATPPALAAEPAILCDSAVRTARDAAAIFSVQRIDDDSVQGARQRSRIDTESAGVRLRIAGAQHTLPAVPVKLVLWGGVVHASAFLGGRRESGVETQDEVTFVPEAGEVYRVHGLVDETSAQVWIEDAGGRIVAAPSVAGATKRPPTSPVGKSRSERFPSLQEGECEPMVEAWLGPPEVVSKRGRFLAPSVAVHAYRGLGELEMDGGVLRRVIPAVSADGLGPAAVRDALHGTEHDALRRLAASYAEAGIRDVAVLDVLAQEVWARHASKDREVADAMAFLARALGGSGNVRYRELLQSVGRQAGHEVLRRHAKKSVKLLPAGDAAQFMPED